MVEIKKEPKGRPFGNKIQERNQLLDFKEASIDKKMGKIVLILLSTIIMAISVIMIYDARIIAKKIFSSNETNETTKVLKIVGFVILLIGLGIVYITVK